MPELMRDGSVDLSDFIGKLKALYPGIEADEVYPKAIRKGAQLLADRIEANTPIGKSEYRYQYEGRTLVVKATHPPGQAQRNVIVYRRKGRGSLVQSEVNANIAFLVGYEKKMAFYMFWNEYGNRYQAARPVIRPVFDAGVDEALQVAVEYIQKDHEKRLQQG
jgi:HK97 gp10 family phage protein